MGLAAVVGREAISLPAGGDRHATPAWPRGTAGSGQVREAARTAKDWYFSRLDGPVASWISEKLLDEQRRMLPPAAYARLWDNVWSSGEGDALGPG